MAHRAGYADPKSCDGAGINLKIDDGFWKDKFPEHCEQIVPDGYAVIASFVPESSNAYTEYAQRIHKH